jgi:hypothetical protein
MRIGTMRVLLKRASVGRILQTTAASFLEQTWKFQLLRRLLQHNTHFRTRGVKNGVKGCPKQHLLHRVDHVTMSRFFLACASNATNSAPLPPTYSIRILAALELGQGVGTAMIMMVMVTFDSLRAMNLAAAPYVANSSGHQKFPGTGLRHQKNASVRITQPLQP